MADSAISGNLKPVSAGSVTIDEAVEGVKMTDKVSWSVLADQALSQVELFPIEVEEVVIASNDLGVQDGGRDVGREVGSQDGGAQGQNGGSQGQRQPTLDMLEKAGRIPTWDWVCRLYRGGLQKIDMKLSVVFLCDREVTPILREDLADTLEPIIALDDVVAMGPLRANNVYEVVLSSAVVKQRVLCAGALRVKGSLCRVVDPVVRQVVCRLHWLPHRVTEMDLRRALGPSGVVTGIIQEKARSPRLKNCSANIWRATLRLHDSVSVDSIPDMVQVGFFTALVSVLDRPPRCLRCGLRGHLRRACSSVVCQSCRSFHAASVSCDHTFAGVARGPRDPPPIDVADAVEVEGDVVQREVGGVESPAPSAPHSAGGAGGLVVDSVAADVAVSPVASGVVGGSGVVPRRKVKPKDRLAWQDVHRGKKRAGSVTPADSGRSPPRTRLRDASGTPDSVPLGTCNSYSVLTEEGEEGTLLNTAAARPLPDLDASDMVPDPPPPPDADFPL